MHRLGLVVLLAACSAKPRNTTTVVYTLAAAPDVAAHPDAEIVVGVLGDDGGRVDVRVQLVAQMQLRVPDLIVTAGGAVLESSRRAALDADGVDYAFAHVTAAADGAIIVGHTGRGGSRIVVDPRELGRMDAAAIVRVRKQALAVDVFGADGIALR